MVQTEDLMSSLSWARLLRCWPLASYSLIISLCADRDPVVLSTGAEDNLAILSACLLSNGRNEPEMKALFLNTLLGICMGRFFSAWFVVLFVPLIAAEVMYGIYLHDLSLPVCIRRSVTLFLTADIAFFLGVLLRPRSGDAWE